MEITFTKQQLAGITCAREHYNDSLPVTYEGEGEDRVEVEPREGSLETNDEYVQMVMDTAANSYIEQFQTDVTKIDRKITELQAKRAEAVELNK